MAAANSVWISLLVSIIIVILFIQAVPTAHSQNDEDQLIWAKRVVSGNQVITNLQFYFHDVVGGRNPSAIRIAEAPQTKNSTTFFGSLMMIDDALTVGPDPASKPVGRARGMYGSAGQTDFGLIMALSYVFSDGIYDGSSFSMLSINPATETVREMAVVGGTGLFRMARGYAIARTYWLNAATGDAIVGYNVTILTYV
ncbi:dirigent protein 23-like [Andrographis paniculata]|uniref:dirigent protein 23-like n=1 Tax=Andrographis paniculata TaxID=175694 RepID=UPI0021E6E394|nr:dirigent protein 23-like [Andrographis paniculata]